MKKKTKEKSLLCACIAAVCVSMISAVHIQGESGKEPLQLADGREELKKLSERTVRKLKRKSVSGIYGKNRNRPRGKTERRMRKCQMPSF